LLKNNVTTLRLNINIFHFITGLDDKTLYFHFGGGLKNWLDSDDPW
jgi:hypothetical protein